MGYNVEFLVVMSEPENTRQNRQNSGFQFKKISVQKIPKYLKVLRQSVAAWLRNFHNQS